MNITDILLAKNCPYSVIDVVPLDVIPFFETLLQRQYPLDRQLRDDCLLWRTWSTSRFCGELRKAVPDTAVARPNSASSFNELIAKLPVYFDLEDPAFELALDEQLRAICAAFPDKTKENELVATKLLISRLPDQPINWQSILFRDIGNRKVGSIDTVSDFRFIWLAQLECLRNKAQDMRDIGWTLIGSDNTKQVPDKVIRKRHPPPSDDQPRSKKPATTVDTVTCTGCGRANHMLETCHFKETKFFNTTDQPYHKSAVYKLLRQQYPTATVAPSKVTEDKLRKSPTRYGDASTSNTKKTKKQKGILVPDSIYFTTITNNKLNTDFISVAISHVSQSLELPTNELKTLLDTGSLAGDFIAKRCVLNLKLESLIVTSKKRIVCSGLDNKCYDISNSIALHVFYFSEKLNKIVHIDINAIILESSPIDLIIGRNTLRQHQLFDQMPSQLKLQSIGLASQGLAGIFPDKVANDCGYNSCVGSQPSLETQNDNLQTKVDYITATKTQHYLASLVTQSETLATIATAADDELDEHETSTFAPWLPTISSDPIASLHIAGDEDLQSKIRSLCLDFVDIFSNELPSAPARIPPFDLVVDDSKWHTPRNRAPPRPQSTSNHADIVRQIKVLEEQGIIEKSQSAYYSQVLMVPKPDGSKRLCVDYRSLNDCTTDASWPIPNIPEMFRRIALQNPTIFGLMDLTQGYHQAPLTQSAKIYTAFILFC